MALHDFWGRRVVLWLSRGIFCPLCRVSFAQMRRYAAAFGERNAQLLEVGPALPTSALRGFPAYLSGREPTFPYLCDPDLAVHHSYHLLQVTPRDTPDPISGATGPIAGRRPGLPEPSVAKSQPPPVEQGLFVIDEIGIIRLRYVTEPAGKLPPMAMLLDVLDGLVPYDR